MKRLVLLIFLFCTSLIGQEIYIVNNLTQLKIIDLSNFSVTDLFSLGTTMTDLAFGPDGKLYSINDQGVVWEIDLVSENTIFITSFPPGQTYTGLVATNDNRLITSPAATGVLHSYDLNTGDFDQIGLGFSTPGDFTYYQGNLVFPSFTGDFIQGFDGSSLTDIGCSVNQLYTFVNDFIDCNNSNVYGIDNLGRVYLYDFVLNTRTEVASLGQFTSSVFGGATRTEHLASACTVEILEERECTLSLASYGAGEFSLYPNPVTSELNLRYPKELSTGTYQWLSITGKVISTGSISSSKISVKELPTGLYFLQLRTELGEVVYHQRVVKN